MKKHLSIFAFLLLAIAFTLSSCKKDKDPVEIESLTVNPLGGTAPLDVTARCIIKSGEVTGFSWDFGDGTTTSGASEVFHRYKSSGVFVLRVTVTGVEGSEKDPYTVTKTAQVTITVLQPNTPPVAGFSWSSTNIIADKTVVNFSNTSTGTISAWQWDFGASERSANGKDQSYMFNYAGTKTVKLTVSGPLGTNVLSKTLTVHAMEPTCQNYTGGSTQSASAIQALRNSGARKIGGVAIENNYGGGVKVEFFHPDSWLNGIYTPFNNSYWSINAKTTNNLTLNNGAFNIGGDWGVRMTYLSNGAISCVRTLQDIGTFSGGRFTIRASRVFEGI